MGFKYFRTTVALLFGAVLMFIPHSHGRGLSHACRTMKFSPVNGPSFSLEDFYGRPLTVIFFQPQCLACRREISRLSRRKDGVVAFSLDNSVERVRKFAKELNLRFPVVVADRKVLQCFGGIEAVPTVFRFNFELFLVRKGDKTTSSSSLNPYCHCSF